MIHADFSTEEMAMFDEIAAAFAAMPAGMSGPFGGCQSVAPLDGGEDEQPAE